MKNLGKLLSLTSLFVLIINANIYAQTELDIKLKTLIEKLKLTALEPPIQYDRAKFNLGRRLFSDPELSGNRNITCMACHHPAFGTSDGLPLSIGQGGKGLGPNRKEAHGKIIARNSPSLINIGYRDINNMFWDGRVSYDPTTRSYQTPEPSLNGKNPTRKDITKNLTGALSAQVIFPITSPEEMRGFSGNELATAKSNQAIWYKVMRRLLFGEKKSTYRKLFKEAFPEVEHVKQFNIGHVGHSLAAFITNAFTLIDTPYDRYLNGDLNAMTVSQKKGLDVFINRGKCILCHSGKHLSTFDFRSAGAPQIAAYGSDMINDRGRFKVSGVKRDSFKFRTPPLRNVSFTAPYMHSGSLKTLRDVVEHYNNIKQSITDFTITADIQKFYDTKILADDNLINNKLRHQLISIDPIRRGLNLTQSEKDNLLDFLEIGLTQVRRSSNKNDSYPFYETNLLIKSKK